MTAKVKGRFIARLADLAVALLVLLFTYTGVSKWLDLPTFASTLYNQPFPFWLAPILARVIPSIEILTALLLLFTHSQRIGLRIALILLVTFSLYTGAVLLHFFHKIPCTCGGIFRYLSWKQHLLVNIGLVLIAFFAFYTKHRSSLISSPLKPSL